MVLLAMLGGISLTACASTPHTAATGNRNSGDANGAAAALGGNGAGSNGTGPAGSGSGNPSGGVSGTDSQAANSTSTSSKAGSGTNSGTGGSSAKGGSTGAANGSGSAGSTGASSGGSKGASSGGGSTFNVPGAGGNVFTASPGTGGSASSGVKSSPSPASSPLPCVNPAAPATVAQGITGAHMDSVDSGGNAHGPATSFSSASVNTVLAVLYLSGLVTGTTITYVEIFCGTTIASETFQLASNSATALMAFKGNPSFSPGLYRLQFYVNATANSAPAFVTDFSFTA